MFLASHEGGKTKPLVSSASKKLTFVSEMATVGEKHPEAISYRKSARLRLDPWADKPGILGFLLIEHVVVDADFTQLLDERT